MRDAVEEEPPGGEGGCAVDGTGRSVGCETEEPAARRGGCTVVGGVEGDGTAWEDGVACEGMVVGDEPNADAGPAADAEAEADGMSGSGVEDEPGMEADPVTGDAPDGVTVVVGVEGLLEASTGKVRMIRVL